MRRLPWAVSAGILLVVLTLCLAWLMRSCARLPGEAVRATGEPSVELGRRIVDGLARRLQLRPEVRVGRETVLAAETALAELATVRREFAHEYVWEHQWLGSTKRLRLRGNFAAKAGFDLYENFHVGIDPQSLRVQAVLPPPRLLGVEMLSYDAEEEDGFWNKLTPAEREEAVNALIASARATADADTGLKNEAQRLLEFQIAAAVAESGGEWGGAVRAD
jgi:hypothetical protein